MKKVIVVCLAVLFRLPALAGETVKVPDSINPRVERTWKGMDAAPWVNPLITIDLDECEAATDWTVMGDDTTNLAASNNHLFGAKSLEFDKANGTDNTKEAGVYKALDSLDLESYMEAGAYLRLSVYLSALTDVDYVMVKIGSTSANNAEYRYADSLLSAGWNEVFVNMADIHTINGTGFDMGDLDYLEVGVLFDAETDTLADIAIDHLAVIAGTMLGISESDSASLAAMATDLAAIEALAITIDADTSTVAAWNSGGHAKVSARAGTFDDDDTSACFALGGAGSEANYTFPDATAEYVIACKGNTAYFLGGDSDPASSVSVAVGNFSFAVADGERTEPKKYTHAKIGYVAAAAGGFCCVEQSDPQ